jgi:nitroreductase
MSTTHPASHTIERDAVIGYGLARAVRAPSVHNTQPWRFQVTGDRIAVRADPSRRLAVLDPHGRELVQSVGAALLNLRVGLAARGWDAEITRLPAPADPDLLAVVRAVPGDASPALAALDPVVALRRTNRRRFEPAPLTDSELRTLAHITADEGAALVPVTSEEHRRLVARLVQRADVEQNADPAYRAELRQWTGRLKDARDGVPAAAVARVDRTPVGDLPLRDFDTRSRAALPAETGSSADQPLILLTTPGDEPIDWLRSGEALQRLLLELTRHGYVAGPMTQPIEVPLTRSQLRSALSWGAHPQMLLRVGRAAPTPATPRRGVADVSRGGLAPADLPESEG